MLAYFNTFFTMVQSLLFVTLFFYALFSVFLDLCYFFMMVNSNPTSLLAGVAIVMILIGGATWVALHLSHLYVCAEIRGFVG